jgi:adenylyltransferase/sulfurtransferase
MKNSSFERLALGLTGIGVMATMAAAFLLISRIAAWNPPVAPANAEAASSAEGDDSMLSVFSRFSHLPSIEPVALKQRMNGVNSIVLLDVREPAEWDFNRIEGAIHIPIAELAARLVELPRDRPIVCYCKVGGRSARATRLLLGNGFEDVFNLSGGILAWSRDVDPSVPTY